MKNLLLIVVLFLSLSIGAQQKFSSDYVRPGVTFISVDLDNGFKLDNANQDNFKAFDLYSQLSTNLALSLDSKSKKFHTTDDYVKGVRQAVASVNGNIWNEVFAIENGQPNYEPLMQRAANSMTENQRAGFVNAFQGLETTAKNQLVMPILSSTYVIAVSSANLSSDVGKKLEGYSADVVWSVYKLKLASGINIQSDLAMFEDKFGADYSTVSSSQFPIELVASGSSTAFSVQSTKDPLGTNVSMDQLRQNLDQAVFAIAVAGAQKEVTDFLPKTRLLADMKISLGSKEGLKVDDRYWSYQVIEDMEGNQELKRMGRDRVKKVGNNEIDLIANPDAKGERTQLYADGGRSSKVGMVSMFKPEAGIGVQAGVKIFGDIGAVPFARVDYRTKVVPNTFAYAEGEFHTDLISASGEPATATLISAGVKKTVNLGRLLALSGWAQYTVSGKLQVNGREEDLLNKPMQFGVDVSVKFGSFHITPQVGFNTDELLYGDSMHFGAAFRFNF